jgi:hypothetical protein
LVFAAGCFYVPGPLAAVPLGQLQFQLGHTGLLVFVRVQDAVALTDDFF